jgi:hypothetical protein
VGWAEAWAPAVARVQAEARVLEGDREAPVEAADLGLVAVGRGLAEGAQAAVLGPEVGLAAVELAVAVEAAEQG